jgi:FkbM family methyltransferase
MKTQIRNLLNKLFNFMGYTLTKYSIYQEYNMLMKNYGINKVIDIGANKGQFAQFIRKSGFMGELHSFEPLDEAFEKISKLSSNDKNWKVYQLAVGDTCGETEINVSENSVSSSILEMNASHLELAPQSRYTKKQTIQIKTLDSLKENLALDKGNIFLKIDTQGFEKNVLLGAEKVLENIKTIQLELSLKPLYNGEELFFDISKYLYDRGYFLVKIIPGIYDKSSRETLQFDGIFHKK